MALGVPLELHKVICRISNGLANAEKDGNGECNHGPELEAVIDVK